jgi:pathogenesis-related protein 1
MQKLVLLCLTLVAIASAAGMHFTLAEQNAILAAHNKERALHKVPAVAHALSHLIWNNDLANTAFKYASRCVYAHNSNRATRGFKNVGENIFASTGTYATSMATQAVQSWVSEKSKYHYQRVTAANFAPTGHYTQVIWANTKSVGCAYAKCASMVNYQPGHTFIVCDYGEAGNYIGQYPYIRVGGTAALEQLEEDE